ncbi:hypothetical protein KCMC57_up62420 [Kitasatospora sp. CMC57]|uniref:Uncharacterized protein n=1 Tax=Kitasatospora sp. CMC57 TaxID=3231513 RepID=A0AB33KAP4_9ACTN
MSLAGRLFEAGGTLAEDLAAHLYRRLLDALAFAPDAENVAVPWRELGRADLTPTVLTNRLEHYIQALFERYEWIRPGVRRRTREPVTPSLVRDEQARSPQAC